MKRANEPQFRILYGSVAGIEVPACQARWHYEHVALAGVGQGVGVPDAVYVSEQSLTRLVAHPVTHEKDLPQGLGLVGVGIGIAFGIEIALGRHVDIDADSDPDADPGITTCRSYFRSRCREYGPSHR